jgi:hypothetical protein
LFEVFLTLLQIYGTYLVLLIAGWERQNLFKIPEAMFRIQIWIRSQIRIDAHLFGPPVRIRIGNTYPDPDAMNLAKIILFTLILIPSLSKMCYVFISLTGMK